MANETPNRDLSDLLISIECLRRELKDTGTDPTARMVHWGRQVLARTNPDMKFNCSFEKKPLEQRWKLVRASLSPPLLKALEVNLREMKRMRGKQLEIGENQDG
ncbi:MAG: hypothetical protein OHK0037_20510 [Elainellaceae cyanobacterium]